MCGISGVVAPSGAVVSCERLGLMTQAIAHRGPDGCGVWVSDDQRVGLGHRRLSIIDLSPAGAQPMVSPSGRYIVSFNGEIYNFVELRSELEKLGVAFRGYSDTEVMLAGFDTWGPQSTQVRMAGMFALAVWDREDESLLITRDRIGIKPLYYSTDQGGLLFASEVRALVVYRGALPPISAQALNEYLRLGYVPGPLSIFEGIFKLQPGCFAVYRKGQLSKPSHYWTLEKAVQVGLSNRLNDESSVIDALDANLRASVRRHMVSDVPLGAFLSGGVDSSTVVALMQAISTRPVKTFSIGFHEQGYNEARHAMAVARHLGTEHHELYVTDQDAMAVIPELPNIYDEPFADASQIPTFLVSKLARQQVTVTLSGDGGDELFAGYNRYVFVANFWQRLRRMPLPIRRGLSNLLTSMSPASWDTWFRRIGDLMPRRLVPALPGQKMHKIASILLSPDLMALHGRLVAQWVDPQTVLKPDWWCKAADGAVGFSRPEGLSDMEQQMLWDSKTYLVDDILTKVDRASMRVGIEARVPLLDHEVVEFAWRVPIDIKLREDGGKWLLRQVLYRYVPRDLIDRPKMGFSIPISSWLRGPLQDWAMSNLDVSRLDREGMLDGTQVHVVLKRHLDGSVDASGPLWTLLMFQLWLERAKTWV